MIDREIEIALESIENRLEKIVEHTLDSRVDEWEGFIQEIKSIISESIESDIENAFESEGFNRQLQSCINEVIDQYNEARKDD